MKRKKTDQLYNIRVQGNLDPKWSEWLGGMSMRCEQASNGLPETVLTGPVADQAALRGILTRLWDLNLDVVSVGRIRRERSRS